MSLSLSPSSRRDTAARVPRGRLPFAAPRPRMVRPGERARPGRLRRSSPTASPGPPLPARSLPCALARRSRPASGDCRSPPVASPLLAHGRSGVDASCPWPALRSGSLLAAGQAAAFAPAHGFAAPHPRPVRRCLPCV
ncbi:hypothetical protein PVAP13_3KG362608 [Panicum virgatum]|uniref:Uncharacterized protein n=1 Tax=Panicum virgatum TaxID=38727 RepID=A0A8T0UPU4_PANVG|nr:hypothetical protein PVAP13_3KG362608 [Panicum virgatum]